MTVYLGDYTEDDTVHFKWNTFNISTGASITRATDGTISVYKDNSATQTTTGITDTEDFDSLTGVHHCAIDLSSDAFYATGADYSVVLSGATINGATVNAVIAHFSIENRVGKDTETNLTTTINALDFNHREIKGDAIYNNGVLTVIAWLSTNGTPDTSASNFTATVRQTDGTLVATMTTDTTPNSDGVFVASQTLSTDLTQYTQYYVECVINDGAGGAGTNRSGKIAIKRFS